MLNNTGSALITGMIAALSVGVVSAVIMQQSQITDRQTRIPRIKSAMSAVESQLREAAYDGSLFTSCVSGDPGYGNPKCKKVDQARVQAVAVAFPGARCEAGAGGVCGIDVEGNPSFDFGTGTLTAQIVYRGTEVAIAPINVSTVITEEIWSKKNSNCPSDRPLLTGFQTNGDPICEGFPIDCTSGKYVKRIDPMSLTGPGAFQCADLPTLQQCPAGRFVSNFGWDGTLVSFHCQDALNPFAANAIGDTTSYEYQPVDSFVSSPWPTTTTTTSTTVPPSTSTTTTTTTTTITLPPVGSCNWERTSFSDGQDPGGQCTGCPGGPNSSCSLRESFDKPCNAATVGDVANDYVCSSGGTSTWESSSWLCTCM